MISDKIVSLIEESIRSLQESGEFKLDKAPKVELERPREKAHGDWATNIALVLSASIKQPSRRIAESIAAHLDDKQQYIDKVEVAGPGFINFFLSPKWLYEGLEDILIRKSSFGHSNLGEGIKVQVEFVSANPVGPMHIGHGRWAAVGDTIANLLSALGYEVEREFYINDYGSQMNIFGKSVAARYCELLGQEVTFPAEGYQGEYIKEIAQEIIQADSDRYLDLSPDKREELFKERAYQQVLEHMKKTLHQIGVDFGIWFSERSLHQSGAIDEVIEELKNKGLVYQGDGALWLRTSEFGDDKDRVLVRESGEPTYFAADIAYHKNKFSRGFNKVINIWGADHHGYVPRMKAAAKALGYPESWIEIIIGQLVNLLRAGEQVKMSKRTGEMVTLDELLSEVGKDAVRFLFLMSDTNNPLDFDIELAKEQSSENPVYYVQYAHARICSILSYAEEQDAYFLSFLDGLRQGKAPECDLLTEEAELNLIRKLLEYEEIVERCALQKAPHHLTQYGQELAALFHVFYTKCRVITADRKQSEARLVLVEATKIILENLLELMGVTAPEKM